MQTSHKLSLTAILILIAIIAFQVNSLFGQKTAETGKMKLIERGEYLVEFGGCHDCHTPKKMTANGPVPNRSLSLSGHPQKAKLPDINPDMVAPGKWVLFNEHSTAAVGPWGVSFAANLTPDIQTGIGLWQENNFIQAMRTGKHLGQGRPLLPPMPWFNLAYLTDDDLKAVFAYLKSIKSIKNSVPAPISIGELKK